MTTNQQISKTSRTITLVPQTHQDCTSDINGNVSPENLCNRKSKKDLGPKPIKSRETARKMDSIVTIAVDHISVVDSSSLSKQPQHHSLPNQIRPRSRSKRARKNVGRFLLWAASKVLF